MCFFQYAERETTHSEVIQFPFFIIDFISATLLTAIPKQFNVCQST